MKRKTHRGICDNCGKRRLLNSKDICFFCYEKMDHGDEIK